MDALPITDRRLDPETRDLIVKCFLPRWFVGSDSQIVTYITGLKKDVYNSPEIQEFLLSLEIKVSDLIKDPYPYFLAINWDWVFWSDLLSCQPSREAVLQELKKKSWKEIDQIVGQKRPSTDIQRVFSFLKGRGEGYLDIDIFVYTTKVKKLTDPQWGITSNSEYRFYAMLSSLEAATIIEVLETLTKNQYYAVDTKEVVEGAALAKYRYQAPWFKICGNDMDRYHNVYRLLAGLKVSELNKIGDK